MERSTFEELYTDVEEVTCPGCGYPFNLRIQGDRKEEVNSDEVECPNCFEIITPVKKDY